MHRAHIHDKERHHDSRRPIQNWVPADKSSQVHPAELVQANVISGSHRQFCKGTPADYSFAERKARGTEVVSDRLSKG